MPAINYLFRGLFLLLFHVTFSTTYSQVEKATDSIMQEGLFLYRLEKASWHGTDLFLEKYTDRNNIGGYFSYMEKDKATCIFFSRTNEPQVLGTIRFDTTFNLQTATVDLKTRGFTSGEKDLYSLRKAAYQLVNQDSLFVYYKDTRFNLIPMIHGGHRKAYVLTATQKPGVVLLGNDYLVYFDPENQVKHKKKLHRNIIELQTSTVDTTQLTFGAIHTHLPETGEFITATDICTLLLYKDFADWKQHIVVSENYMSILNLESINLMILPKEVIERIEKDQKKRRSKQ